mgnify:FL=1
MFSASPRQVSPEKAGEIFKAAGPYMGRVCVTHTDSPDNINRILALHPTAIQISHPHSFPENRTYQVIRVIKPGDIIPESADAIIVDASMGKGTLYDHTYAQKVISMSQIPVILAGGLNPKNVEAAVRSLRPYAVDVASGVEMAPGIKDEQKVLEFVRRAREASHAT